ncbi:MAG: DUF2079 domain-containing protein, partial [Ruminococcus sp.]|nr:DUF2079 domain-containing protein [Ruminococcus sp.]
MNENQYTTENIAEDTLPLGSPPNGSENAELPTEKLKRLWTEYRDVIFMENGLVKRLIAAFLAVIVNILPTDRLAFNTEWKEYTVSITWLRFLTSFAGIFIAMTICSVIARNARKIKLDSYFLAAFIGLFGISSLWRSNNFYLALSVSAVCVGIGLLFLKKSDFGELLHLPRYSFKIVIFVLFAVISSFIGIMCVYSYWSYGKSTYDFGIFVQMYHSMITNFDAFTTCEREVPVSHFDIHFSWGYWFFAPIYYIFPHQETLLILQAIVSMSGVLPLWLICKKYNYSDIGKFLFAIIFLTSLAMIMPNFYDFHENSFLPPALLWFIYAIEKKKIILSYILLLVCLSIKEDVPFYTICIGIYFMFVKPNMSETNGEKGKLLKDTRFHALIQVVLSIIYFIAVSKHLESAGYGTMLSSRYGNLMTDVDAGAFNLLETVIKNPIYFLSQCFNEERLVFVLQMLVPLAFIPFVTKKINRLVLIFPFIVFNLASSWKYQYNIGYQYVYGTGALLLYLCVINLKDFKLKNRHIALCTMFAVSVCICTAMLSPSISKYENYKKQEVRFTTIDAYLEAIPKEFSVLSDTYLLPKMANRDHIYRLSDETLKKPITADYVVTQDNNSEFNTKLYTQLVQQGYIQ